MSNYPDNFNSRAFNALYAPSFLTVQWQEMDNARDDVNRAVAAMQQAVHYTNESLKHIITDVHERHEWAGDVYNMLHDKITDGYHDELNMIERVEGIRPSLPSFTGMLRGVNKLQVAS